MRCELIVRLPTIFQTENKSLSRSLPQKTQPKCVLTLDIGDFFVQASLGGHPHHQIALKALQQQAEGNWKDDKKINIWLESGQILP